MDKDEIQEGLTFLLGRAGNAIATLESEAKRQHQKLSDLSSIKQKISSQEQTIESLKKLAGDRGKIIKKLEEEKSEQAIKNEKELSKLRGTVRLPEDVKRIRDLEDEVNACRAWINSRDEK